AGTQMASDVALGTLTGGSATIPLAIRSFGGGAQQARQAGATENQQIAYGTASALKEALTEKMFDGLAGVYGKGTADDFVDALARSFAKSDGGQALVRGLVNMGGEGAEEIASGFIDPALQGIYNGKTLGENYRELNMADLLHEGAVGMLLGNLGGSVDIARTMSGNPRSNLSYTDVLNEMNLSTPNNYAMNRAGNIAVGGKTDYTENNKTEAQNYAKVYLRDSDKRFGGAYSGGQVSAVEESAGRAARGQATLRPADSEAASLTFGKAVSAASLGIDGGSEQATLHLLRGDETLCTARAKRIASDRGLQLVLFAGDNLRITQANGTTASVRGYISGNRVFVRADHPRYTSEQIMLHEAGHNMIAMGEIDLNEVRDYIGENHSVGKTAQLYMDAYAGTDMTADEIWEELICDSLGNMNIFSETLGEEIAQEHLMETRRAVEAVQRESVGSRAPQTNGKTSREYWRSDLTKAQMQKLVQWAKYDMQTSENRVTDAANWTFRSFDGLPVFAIYSTEDQINPTILYETKGERAEFERDILNSILEEINYVERVDGKSEAISKILDGSWMRKDRGHFNDYGAMGRRRSIGDVGVLQKQSKRKPSAAFKSVLRNLFSIRAGRVK
ncbi:MAG: hypothetical protein IKB58_01130, partial [Oscillospiraceae bacterium]|nr:hypothetical protein [Oscillospiraceae bacterium]